MYCTDGDPANRDAAERHLTTAGVWDRIEFHVSDAVTALGITPATFGIVYNDLDKDGYSAAWEASPGPRIRVGDLYLCDKVLWSGQVAAQPFRLRRQGYTEPIVAHNRAIANDPDFCR